MIGKKCLSIMKKPLPTRRGNSLFVLGDKGQATLEYVVVGSALLIVVLVLGQLLGVVRDGTFVLHISQSASHVLDADALEVINDVLYF